MAPDYIKIKIEGVEQETATTVQLLKYRQDRYFQNFIEELGSQTDGRMAANQKGIQRTMTQKHVEKGQQGIVHHPSDVEANQEVQDRLEKIKDKYGSQVSASKCCSWNDCW